MKYHLIILLLFALLLSCCEEGTKTDPGKAQAQKNDALKSSTNKTDTIALQSQAYSQAIDAWLVAVYQKDRSVFDTVFIGRHPDFPDVQLPEKIGNACVQLISQEEVGEKLRYRKIIPFINMVGTITKDTADLMLIIFRVEQAGNRSAFIPQHNCLVDLTRADEKFNVKQVRFEYPYPGPKTKMK